MPIVETLYREWTWAGVRVVSVSEAMLDDSLNGHLVRTILAGFAEYERAVLALRTSSGRKARVTITDTFHGGVPYGYHATGDRRQSGHGVLAIEERHAVAVRRAFALHDDTKMTLMQIAAVLNDDKGYRTAEGAAFTGKQVRRIVDRRAVYAGLAATTPSVALNAGVAAAHPAILRAPMS